MGEKEEVAARDAWQVGVAIQLLKTHIECDRLASHRRGETRKPLSSGTSWKSESRLSKVMLIGWTRNSGAYLPPEKMVGVMSHCHFLIIVHPLRRNRTQITVLELLKTITRN